MYLCILCVCAHGLVCVIDTCFFILIFSDSDSLQWWLCHLSSDYHFPALLLKAFPSPALFPPIFSFSLFFSLLFFRPGIRTLPSSKLPLPPPRPPLLRSWALERILFYNRIMAHVMFKERHNVLTKKHENLKYIQTNIM